MARKSLVLLLLGLVGYAAAAGVPERGSTAPSAASAPAWFTLRGKVTRVVDGDTIHVRIGMKTEKVRLIGIDSPEVGNCFSQEATRAMRAMVHAQGVRLVGDRSQTRRDRYQRLLAYVILPTGLDAGRNLLVRGLAELYVTSPRFARYQVYAAAASDASAQAIGLHASCLGSPPPTTTAEPVNPPIPIPSTPTRTAVAPLTPPANCAPSYPDVCIPPPPPDLDCGQVAHRRFRVISTSEEVFGMTVQTAKTETQQAALVHQVAVDVKREAVQKIATLRPGEVQFAVMSDLELVDTTYDLVGTIKSDALCDRFYGLIEELLERFAPAVQWAHIEQQYEDDDNRLNELAGCRESIERREAARELFRGARVKGGEESV